MNQELDYQTKCSIFANVASIAGTKSIIETYSRAYQEMPEKIYISTITHDLHDEETNEFIYLSFAVKRCEKNTDKRLNLVENKLMNLVKAIAEVESEIYRLQYDSEAVELESHMEYKHDFELAPCSKSEFIKKMNENIREKRNTNHSFLIKNSGVMFVLGYDLSINLYHTQKQEDLFFHSQIKEQGLVIHGPGLVFDKENPSDIEMLRPGNPFDRSTDDLMALCIQHWKEGKGFSSIEKEG